MGKTKVTTGRKEFSLEPSTIESVDTAVYNWLNENMNIHTQTKDGWEKTKVVWVSAERVYQVKRDIYKGYLQLPLVTIERTGVDKDAAKIGRFGGWHPALKGYDPRGGVVPVSYRINQEKSSKFNNADAKRKRGQINFPKIDDKVVFDVAYISMPYYVEMTYKVLLRSEYQQQMNELIQPFLEIGQRTNYFIVENEGHRYEGRIQGDFNLNNNVGNMDSDIRNFETDMTIKIIAYLVGAGKNDPKPKVSIRETATEFKWNRERTIFEDEIEHEKPGTEAGIEDKKYRP